MEPPEESQDISGADDVAGGAGMKRQKAGSGRKVHRTASASTLLGDFDTCFVCENPVCGPAKKLKGFVFDAECHAAVRCKRRLIANDKEKIVAENAQMLGDPAAWRLTVLPLVKGLGSAGRTHARQNLQAVVSADVETSGTKNISDKIWLTKRRFKSYRKLWDALSSSHASQKFDEQLSDNSSDNKNSDGEPQVQVRDNMRERQSAGSKHVVTRKRTRPDAGRRQEKSSSRGRDRERRRDRSRRRTRTPTQEPPQGQRAKPSRRSSHKDDASEPVRLTEKRLKEHNDGAESVASAKHSDRPSLADPGRSPGKITMAEVMKLKSTLKAELKTAAAASIDKKSVKFRIEALVRKLDAQQVSSFEKPPKDAIDAIDTVRADIAKHLDGIEACKTAQLEQCQERAKTLLKSLAEAELEASETLEAVSFVLGEVTNEKRKKTNAENYQRDKMAAKMISAGVGKGAAKLVAAKIKQASQSESDPKCLEAVCSNPKCKDMKFDAVCLWEPNNENGKVVCDLISEVMASSTVDAQQKTQDLVNSCYSHDKWLGALCKLDIHKDVLKMEGARVEQCIYNDHVGAASWLAAFKPFAWRFGPAAFPLPGIGTFVRPLTNGCVLLLFKIDPLVDSGISLDDLMSHLDTNTGEKYFNANAVVLPLGKDCSVWIPWGWKAVPMAVPAEELKKDQEEKEHYGVLWAMPFFHTNLAHALSPNCLQSVLKMNGDWLAQKKSTPMWQARAELWQQFTAEVKKDQVKKEE